MSGRDMKRGAVNSTLTRGYGTLAGLGIIGAAVLAVPSTLFLDPRPEAEAYFSTVAALVVGLCCMALPWERIDARWLHLVGLLAIVQAAVAVAVFGQAYVAFYFLIAVAAAYMTVDLEGASPADCVDRRRALRPRRLGPAGARGNAPGGARRLPASLSHDRALRLPAPSDGRRSELLQGVRRGDALARHANRGTSAALPDSRSRSRATCRRGRRTGASRPASRQPRRACSPCPFSPPAWPQPG